jgi:hypothetical protein
MPIASTSASAGVSEEAISELVEGMEKVLVGEAEAEMVDLA